MLNPDSLYTNINLYDHSANRKKIKFAFDFAKSNHKGQFRGTGEDYFRGKNHALHRLAVSCLQPMTQFY